MLVLEPRKVLGYMARGMTFSDGIKAVTLLTLRRMFLHYRAGLM